jgi:hypothetical protein
MREASSSKPVGTEAKGAEGGTVVRFLVFNTTLILVVAILREEWVGVALLL